MIHLYKQILVVIILSLALSSCSTSLRDYENASKQLKLDTFFSGDMIAHGVIFNFKNKLTRNFCAEINGVWTEQDGQIKGVLDEQFYFDDGEKQTREWTIYKSENDVYTGTAGDVIGEAKGRVIGNTLHWLYSLQITLDKGTPDESVINVGVDDWIYLLSQNSAFNKTKLKKFGITVGEVSIFFDKNQSSCKSYLI